MVINWPAHLPRHSVRATANGEVCDVIDSGCGAIVMLEGEGAVTVTLDTGPAPLPAAGVEVKPLRLNITPEVAGGRITFTLDGPADIAAVIPGIGDVYIFYAAPDRSRPAADAPGVHYFGGGQIHQVGILKLKDNEEVYVEAGSVLSGAICAENASHVKIHGRGIIDGIGLVRARKSVNSFLCERASDVILQDLTFINAATWTVKVCCSRQVTVENIRIVVYGNAHDGLDINASRDVAVRGCFIRSEDDCVAIKSAGYGHDPHALLDNVENILVEQCTLYSFGGGSAMEMGHEFRCDYVRHVIWRDIDVLAVHVYGSALSIRNCDAATISDVLYDDIRVEHHYDAFLVFRLMKNRYSWSDRPDAGHADHITVRNVRARVSLYNPGYTVSDIGGFDSEHAFAGIHFENCYYGDRRITSLDDFACYAKHTTDITFA